MTITLNSVGKRYNFEWIFSKLNYQFQSGNAYAIVGPNGSGKSTLLQIIAGNLSSSEGEINYSIGDAKIAQEDIFRYVSFCSPYLELPEELTVKEMLEFHGKFKTLSASVTLKDILEQSGLQKHSDKHIKYLSSGLKQRLKLSLSFYSDTPILLLDEPTTNLDEVGAIWYTSTVEPLKKNKLVIISSNTSREYSFCGQVLNVTDWKRQGADDKGSAH